jgi:hypothetical protein
MLTNHPFKYGYGVLLHSGYHYIDIFVNLININKELFEFDTNDLKIKTYSTNPAQMLNPFIKKFYEEKFNLTDEISQNIKFGENDISIIGQLQKDNNIYTNFSIKLLENTLSLRKDSETPKNHYLDSGRIRQENVIIHIGQLCSIHIISNPYEKLGQNEKDEFVIEIMHNKYLTDREPIVCIDSHKLKEIYNDSSIGNKMNIKARENQLKEFLLGKNGNSQLESHKDSILFLDKIYKQL